MTIRNNKNQAIRLRNKGYSLTEIAKELGISKSTVSYHTHNIVLSNKAIQRINALNEMGRKKGHESRKKNNIAKNDTVKNNLYLQYFSLLSLNQQNALLICSILYWAEGSKQGPYVCFTNSDPIMIGVFLKCFRRAFALDESKFRGLIHLHEYHNASDELQFWSGVTSIACEQFNKPYLKPHTGIRRKNEYHGTVRVRYYDSQIAMTLKSAYNVIAEIIGV